MDTDEPVAVELFQLAAQGGNLVFGGVGHADLSVQAVGVYNDVPTAKHKALVTSRVHPRSTGMRYLLPLLCLSTPAAAWEFTPGLPCLLTHSEANVAVELTHDPTQPLFTITLTQATPWPQADVFSLRFEGAAGLTISTNRHQLSKDGRSLTVTDTGFGNVLNGLAFNQRAVAVIGPVEIGVSLDGANAPTEAFRACAVDPAV